MQQITDAPLQKDTQLAGLTREEVLAAVTACFHAEWIDMRNRLPEPQDFIPGHWAVMYLNEGDRLLQYDFIIPPHATHWHRVQLAPIPQPALSPPMNIHTDPKEPLKELEDLFGIDYNPEFPLPDLAQRIAHLKTHIGITQMELYDARAHLSCYRAKDEYSRQCPQIHIGAFRRWWFWHNPIDWMRSLFSS